MPAGNWRVWLLMAGRGFGKTRTGAEATREVVETGRAGRIALVAQRGPDARDVMIEGESGILAISPPHFRPLWEPSKRKLTWPNGAQAQYFSAEEPDTLRGPQFDWAWGDELAKWRYEEAWSNLMFALRLGDDPRCVVTTTPKPTKMVKELLTRRQDMADGDLDELRDVHLTHGTTYENRSNLAPPFFRDIIKRYEGTRLGRQELEALMIEDAEGALWKRAMIEALRVLRYPELRKIVVAIDPPASSGEEASEAGITVAGVGEDNHGYVLEDLSGVMKPHEWASVAVGAYRKWEANSIIAEANNGGEMVEHTIRTVDANVPVRIVHASRGKRTRAEPISSLYEKGFVHHVGAFPDMEDQMCTWEPNTGAKSPDRMDSVVWALTDLLISSQVETWRASQIITPPRRPSAMNALRDLRR